MTAAYATAAMSRPIVCLSQSIRTQSKLRRLDHPNRPARAMPANNNSPLTSSRGQSIQKSLMTTATFPFSKRTHRLWKFAKALGSALGSSIVWPVSTRVLERPCLDPTRSG